MTARYAFRHALYQQAAYERLGAVRLVQIHRRIGNRLEHAYGPQASALAAELARHFVLGREPHRAVQYLRQAAETVLHRHAHQEAIDYLGRALEILKTLPDTPERTQQELQLQVALGEPLMATRGQGAPEVEQTYARAYALCQQVEESVQLLPVLAGLRRFYVVRGMHQTALEIGERLLTLAQRLQDQRFLLEAHRSLGTTRLFWGQFAPALAHLEQAIALYEPQQPRASHVYRPGQRRKRQ